jgi:nitrate/nitrite transporter NarK
MSKAGEERQDRPCEGSCVAGIVGEPGNLGANSLSQLLAFVSGLRHSYLLLLLLRRMMVICLSTTKQLEQHSQLF